MSGSTGPSRWLMTPENGDSDVHSISADGRFVIFGSMADNLTSDTDNNHSRDIFLWDATSAAVEGKYVARFTFRAPDLAGAAISILCTNVFRAAAGPANSGH